MRDRSLFLLVLFSLAACSSEPDVQPNTSPDNSEAMENQMEGPDQGGQDQGEGAEDMEPAGEDMSTPGEDMGAGGDMASAEDMPPAVTCDYRTVDGIAVFEAESLPITEDWATSTERDGFSGDGYIEWGGSSHNNDPTHGRFDVRIQIAEAGRYQMQWRVRIGRGDNTTEHNDAWVRWPDAEDYYGLKGNDNAEQRRYPKPQCEDDALMGPIRALAQVDEAICARGSTRDGWHKVYSSGASDWKWSARTSDNDASDIMVEFAAPGVYTLQMAARADFFLIDRIVLHREGLDNDAVRELALEETDCP